MANSAARGLQGISSLRQGSVLGGVAALGSGVADGIGRAAEGAATGLQKFANQLGDTSEKLSYAARGKGIVDGYRAAGKAVNEARVALRQAEASGDPTAIAAAREQLAAAEKAKTCTLLSGAASAAGLAADVRTNYAEFAGDARQSPIPQTGLDQALRGAERGLGVAQGLHSGDYAAAGVNALGMAAVGRSALGGESDTHLGLTDAAHLADAGLAYHQTNSAHAAADQAVVDAEAALDAARRTGDAAAIQAAQAGLDQARRSREGALMGAIGAGDGLVQTAAQMGESYRQRAARVDELDPAPEGEGSILVALVEDEQDVEGVQGSEAPDSARERQTLERNGIEISAPAGVSEQALEAAADIVGQLIGANEAMAEKLKNARVVVVVVPHNKKLTDLPEFSHLRGKKTFDGRTWDDVRGVGGVSLANGGKAVAAPEENLVVLPNVVDTYGPGYSVGMHELAHVVNSNGLSKEQRRRVDDLYEARKSDRGPWTDDYASKSAREYFAQATVAFFNKNSGIGHNSAEWLKKNDPEMYSFLKKLYVGR
jgi:hypothetical protein